MGVCVGGTGGDAAVINECAVAGGADRDRSSPDGEVGEGDGVVGDAEFGGGEG